MDTLNAEEYLDEVKDYNGEACDINASYVISVKVAREKYDYALCLRCSNDDYENTNSEYCDSAWDNNYGYRKVVYDEPKTVYVYKDTSREKLKELVVAYPNIRRCRGLDASCTDYIKEVSGKGDEGIQPLYPKDLDKVNTSVVGTYKVHYQMDETADEVEGNVEVYRNPSSASKLTLEKLNIVFDKDVSSSVTTTTNEVKNSYSPTNNNDWAQRIKITFADPFVDEHGNPLSGAYSSTDPEDKIYVARYQWYTGGRWQDVCVPNKNHNDCTAYIGRDAATDYHVELNDDVKFRYIDNKNNISEETSNYKFRIDYTAPTCTLKTTGTIRNGWYIDETVPIEFEGKSDPQTTSIKTGTNVKSDINIYNILTSGTRPTSNKDRATQTNDTTSVTWYGYVEDKANKYHICSTSFKKDSKTPTCSISGHNSLSCNDATSGLVKVSWSQTANNTGGTTLNKKASWSDTPTVSTEGRWYLKATDDAQWTKEISTMYCKITYNANGGTTPKKNGTNKTSEILRETELADLTPTSTRRGYTFHGWNLNSTDTSGLSSFTVREESTRTLYATWTPNTYTITLNKQNGSGGTSTIYQKYDTGWYSNATATSGISSVTPPTRKGWTFKGYYTSTNGGGTQIINESGTIVGANNTFAENTSIYTKWAPNPLYFDNQSFNAFIINKQQTLTFTGASNGTDHYTYSETSEKNSSGTATSYFSVSGTTITIASNVAEGTYYLVVHVEDTESGSVKDATMTIEMKYNPAVLKCKNRTYNGSEQKLYSDATGCASVTNGKKTNAGGPWTLTCIPDDTHSAPEPCTAKMEKANGYVNVTGERLHTTNYTTTDYGTINAMIDGDSTLGVSASGNISCSVGDSSIGICTVNSNSKITLRGRTFGRTTITITAAETANYKSAKYSNTYSIGDWYFSGTVYGDVSDCVGSSAGTECFWACNTSEWSYSCNNGDKPAGSGDPTGNQGGGHCWCHYQG